MQKLPIKIKIQKEFFYMKAHSLTKINGINIQGNLQTEIINMIKILAEQILFLLKIKDKIVKIANNKQ